MGQYSAGQHQERHHRHRAVQPRWTLAEFANRRLDLVAMIRA